LYPGEEHVWHPFTTTPSPGPERALITRAQGAYVWDSNGRRFLDATSSWWCNIHGHGHPRLVSAIAKQAAELDHVMFAPHSHPKALALATALVEALGPPFSRVFYSDNGSTAVETALKIAAQYWQLKGEPQRTRYLSMDRAYHGDTVGAMSVTHLSQFQGPFDHLKFPVARATAPYCYRCPKGLAYPGCDIACLDEATREIKAQGESIAALIVEPLLMGAGGMIMYPREYLERLMRMCRERGILIIFDEVLTGFGRTGPLFAMEHIEARPDMVCLSKGLTAGMLPMGATVVTEPLYEAFVGGPERTLYHGHTHTANATTCALALENLVMFQEERVIERNQTLVKMLAEAVTRFQSLSLVGDVRHLGMVLALELVTDRETKTVSEPANALGWSIAERMWERGYWLRPLNQMIYVMPPYCVTPGELQHLLDELYRAVASTSFGAIFAGQGEET
jgi:adenosylmethionine-8-amino-7-oxononanoate aminotransferase